MTMPDYPGAADEVRTAIKQSRISATHSETEPAALRLKFSTMPFSAKCSGDLKRSTASQPGKVKRDDIAGPVAFLLWDDAQWITGQTLVVDGGAHIVGAGLQG